MIKAYIDNRDTTLFALHSGITRAAAEIGMVFGPIYLYQHGFSLSVVFLIFGLIHLLRIPCRRFAVPLINRFGLKITQFIGAAGLGISFLILPFVKGIDIFLFGHVLLFIVFQPIFWICYHLLYTLYGETSKRARQIAFKNIMDDAGKALLPLIAGVMITLQGYFLYYSFAFAVIVLGFIPLCFSSPVKMEKIKISDFKPKEFKTNYPLFFLWAIKDTLIIQAWYFVLVIMGTSNLMQFGGYVALGIVFKSLLTIATGHFIDKGKINALNNSAFGLFGLSALCRTFVPLNFIGIAAAEGVSSLAFIIRNMMGSSIAYNNGKGQSQAFWYWMVLESAWDTGVFIAGIMLSAGVYAGFPLRMLIIAAVPFSFAWWLYLRKQIVQKI